MTISFGFLRSRLGDLCVRQDTERLSLILSAEEHNTFEEMRGEGGVLFAELSV